MTSVSELMNLTGRRALITGANGALGRIIADTLAELGADLILVDRPGADFSKLINQLSDKWDSNAWVLECDLESENERLELISSIKNDKGGLDILINNAAFVGTSNLKGWGVPFEEQTLDTWRRALEVNLTAAFHLSQRFAPELRTARVGSILNIASIYGEDGPDWRLYEGTTMGNPAAYGASKGGLIQLSRWMATTLAPDVRVNVISPGGIFRNQPDNFVSRYEYQTPLSRMATEDDMRGAIAFLVSDLGRYVTGQCIRVDGGKGAW